MHVDNLQLVTPFVLDYKKICLQVDEPREMAMLRYSFVCAGHPEHHPASINEIKHIINGNTCFIALRNVCFSTCFQ